MKTRSQSKLAAAAAAKALSEQPFRFLDLPKELRLMVYEELMDNPKNDIKFTAPRNLDIDLVYLDGMFYPNLLQVSKQVRDEYWPLCLRKSVLCIYYTSRYPDTPSDEESEENNEENEPTIPLLSEWLRLPIKVLVRITEVMFKFTAMWTLPDFNPFCGIAYCTRELLSLKHIQIWSQMDVEAIEDGPQSERDKKFQGFTQWLFDEDMALFEIVDEEYRKFEFRVNSELYTPLYEMNKNYCWPRRRHLEQGVAPLAGLPEWGYSMFSLNAPWERDLERSFTYRGVEMMFLCVEDELPVFPRSEIDCDSPSEFDYEFDESGWATGRMPDRS